MVGAEGGYKAPRCDLRAVGYADLSLSVADDETAAFVADRISLSRAPRPRLRDAGRLTGDDLAGTRAGTAAGR